MACPTMFFVMVREMSGLVRPYGFRSSSSSVGSSVARASDASVSMMRFTQSIWIALSGESCRRHAPARHGYRHEVGTQTRRWIFKINVRYNATWDCHSACATADFRFWANFVNANLHITSCLQIRNRNTLPNLQDQAHLWKKDGCRCRACAAFEFPGFHVSH